MTRWILLLLAASCSCDPSTWTIGPPEEPPVLCAAYCAKIEQCSPELHYAACAADCETIVGNPTHQEVSGITVAFASCWAQAQTCTQARACE